MSEQNNTLQALSQGFITREVPGNLVEQSTVISTPSKTELVQIGAPINCNNILVSNLIGNDDNIIEFNFVNNTGADQTVYFSSLFGQPGDHEAFGQPPSAVDFPNFEEVGSLDPSNTGSLRGFNFRTGIMGLLISVFTIQTTSLAQAGQPLIIGFLTKTLTRKESKKIPAFCDACFNNNSSAYTKEFRGVFAWGKANYLGYKVLAGSNVLIRIELLAEANCEGYTAI